MLLQSDQMILILDGMLARGGDVGFSLLCSDEGRGSHVSRSSPPTSLFGCATGSISVFQNLVKKRFNGDFISCCSNESVDV